MRLEPKQLQMLALTRQRKVTMGGMVTMVPVPTTPGDRATRQAVEAVVVDLQMAAAAVLVKQEVAILIGEQVVVVAMVPVEDGVEAIIVEPEVAPMAIQVLLRYIWEQVAVVDPGVLILTAVAGIQFRVVTTLAVEAELY